jgi:membrane-associated phospholipid phosphatase
VKRERISSRAGSTGVAAFAAIVGAAVYAVSVGTRAGRDLDRYVDRHRIESLLERVGDGVVSLVNPVTLIAAVAILLWGARRAGRYGDAVRGAAVVAATVGASFGLKALLGEVDPLGGEHARALGASFFPSGHAAATMAVALSALLVFPERRRALAPGAWALTSVVGFFTFAGRDHHVSDVVGGLLLALAIAALAVPRHPAPAGESAVGEPRPGTRGARATAFAAAVGIGTAAVLLAQAIRFLATDSSRLLDLLVVVAAGAAVSAVAYAIVRCFVDLIDAPRAHPPAGGKKATARARPRRHPAWSSRQ